MHNQRHPHQSQQQHQHPGFPPHPSGGDGSMSSPITEKDRQLLIKLLNNPQEAQDTFRMLQNSPPEIATLGHLILTVFERLPNS